MELNVTIDDLKDKKLFVATPMYGGQCAGMFCKATNDLSAACAKFGLGLQFYYLFNESLITRARNYCVDEFLRSDNTHLLFIDSDIGFNYQDVFALLHLCGDPNEQEGAMEVVTGPYPKKTIAWEKVKKAMDRGYGEKNPFELENFVGDYVFNPAEGVTSFKIGDPVEIREGGTGFMMIHRSVFEKYEKAYPELKYKPDHARTEHFDGSRMITAYFDTIIDPETKRYLSEDYMFSYNARKIGIKIWMCPWMKLKHVGSYIFGGSMEAMAAIQASPTASTASNKKFYEKDLTNQSQDDKMQELNRKQRRAMEKKKGNK